MKLVEIDEAIGVINDHACQILNSSPELSDRQKMIDLAKQIVASFDGQEMTVVWASLAMGLAFVHETEYKSLLEKAVIAIEKLHAKE